MRSVGGGIKKKSGSGNENDSLKSLARQLKTSIDRLLRILKNYGLFNVTDFTFRSRKLEALMKPLDDKRKAMKARSCDNGGTIVLRNVCNSL